MTPGERQNLSDYLDTVTDMCKMDIAVITTTDTGEKSPREFTDDFYDSTGYDSDGILLFINPDTHDWYISASGNAMTELTDDEIDELIDYSFGDFNDNYNTAFLKFADKVPFLIGNSEKYSTVSSPHGFVCGKTLLIAVIIGFFGGWIPAAAEKKKLKSVRSDDRAENYVRENSFELTEQKDIYLYSNITRTAKPQNDSNRGSSHTSSSGESHSGHGGKF